MVLGIEFSTYHVYHPTMVWRAGPTKGIGMDPLKLPSPMVEGILPSPCVLWRGGGTSTGGNVNVMSCRATPPLPLLLVYNLYFQSRICIKGASLASSCFQKRASSALSCIP